MRETYQPIREILNYLRGVHGEAAACCAGAKDAFAEPNGASAERLQMLTDFFREGEVQVATHLNSGAEAAQAEVLDTWVQFVPTGDVDQALDDLHAATEEGPAPTFAACLALHKQMVKALRHLVEIVPAEEARDMLQHLADMEEQAMRELSMADTMGQDG